jgi:hypothetical protein
MDITVRISNLAQADITPIWLKMLERGWSRHACPMDVGSDPNISFNLTLNPVSPNLR